MPWAGGVFTQTNGVYTGSTIWNNDKTAGTLITAAHHDTHDYDIAQGINACVAKDGSNTVTLLQLSGTVNASSGIIKVGSLVLASTYGTNNAFYGGAGNFTLTGASDTALGNGAFIAATTAASSTAVGANALAACTTGGSNTAVGASSLVALTTGVDNVAVGYAALSALTTGDNNTAVGWAALHLCTSGTINSALGESALANCTTGAVNTGIGFNALPAVTTGSNNVGIGHSADVPDGTGNGQLSVQNALYGIANTGTSSTLSTGNLGVYVKAPTARLHLVAGTATAGTAPLKLTSGTVLASPEDGALEYDGTHLWFTHGVTRVQIV
jgi:hypothetical protein